MKEIVGNRERDVNALKQLLPLEDVLFTTYATENGIAFTVVYLDPLTDKAVLGEQVVRPLLCYRGEGNATALSARLTAPELKSTKEFSVLVEEILAGNSAILFESGDEAIVAGTKKVFVRAVAEPPTDIALKGPREGFIEDVKINASLVRRRLKTPDLKVETLSVGTRSNASVCIFYLDGIADRKTVEQVKAKLKKINVDVLPDSSYLTRFLSERPRSLVKQVGTTEKPDIFCAKIAEGRVGILVDGSPVALTVPYLLVEDFQSAEDYFVPSYRATMVRILRVFALIVAIYAPAFYIAAQLFKLQLIPVKLLLTIAGSIRHIPLSPSLEMLLVLLVLEVLNEASIRMPKYVGMALSVVGALVLGETAVSAGFVSTPAIIIIAFSGIGLYAVPNLIEVTSVLRLCMLLVAGSVGPYGIILFTAFILFYLTATESFGTPVLAPFSPVVKSDLYDSLVRYHFDALAMRPRSLKSKNRRRAKKGE